MLRIVRQVYTIERTQTSFRFVLLGGSVRVPPNKNTDIIMDPYTYPIIAAYLGSRGESHG